MIERIYVNNYRCFENFSLDLTARPSALIIGKNGAGKSTLRHAFAVFQKICRGNNRLKDLITKSDFTQQRTHIPMRFEIELTLAGNRFKYSISFEMPENFREARVAEESLSVNGAPIFSREQAKITLQGGTTFGLDWHVVALPVIKERTEENLIQQLKTFFASMILIAPIPRNMSGFSEEGNFELEDDAGNLSAWLNALLLRYPAAYSVLFSYLKAVIPDLASFENRPSGEKGNQLFISFEQQEPKNSQSESEYSQSEPDSALVVDFKQLSDGEKCFFLSAVIAAFNNFRGPAFCIWDEPDNHLALSEIDHFIIQLRKLTNQNGQLIATSHHPEAIRQFSDENTLVFSRKSHLEPTIVRTLAEFQYHGDLIEALVRGEVIG